MMADRVLSLASLSWQGWALVVFVCWAGIALAVWAWRWARRRLGARGLGWKPSDQGWLPVQVESVSADVPADAGPGSGPRPPTVEEEQMARHWRRVRLGVVSYPAVHGGPFCKDRLVEPEEMRAGWGRLVDAFEVAEAARARLLAASADAAGPAWDPEREVAVRETP